MKNRVSNSRNIDLYRLSYYLFFGILLFIDSSFISNVKNPSCKMIAFILLGFAMVCYLFKILNTHINLVQKISVIAAFGIILFYYYKLRDAELLFLMLLILIGIKDIEVEDLLKIGAVIKGFALLITLILVLTGVVVQDRFPMARKGLQYVNSLGFVDCNQAFEQFMTFSMVFFLAFGKKFKYSKYIVFTLIIGLSFFFFGSRTGLVSSFCFLIGMLVWSVLKNKKYGKIYLYFLACIPALMVVLTFFLCFCYRNYTIGRIINSFVTGRIGIMDSYLSNKPICWFGRSGYVSFDMMFFQVYYNFGIIFLVIIMVFATFCTFDLVKQNNGEALVFIAAMAVWSLMEGTGMEIGNLSLLYIGSWFYQKTSVFDSEKE